MNNIKGTGPYLLTNFIKNWKTPKGEIATRLIKCHLWFSTLDEITEFVEAYQHVPGYVPIVFDKENSESWPPFYTAKMSFEK